MTQYQARYFVLDTNLGKGDDCMKLIKKLLMQITCILQKDTYSNVWRLTSFSFFDFNAYL